MTRLMELSDGATVDLERDDDRAEVVVIRKEGPDGSAAMRIRLSELENIRQAVDAHRKGASTGGTSG